MKEYMVRLIDFRGSVIDGYWYKAANMTQAKKMYEKRMQNIGLIKRPHDTIKVSKCY